MPKNQDGRMAPKKPGRLGDIEKRVARWVGSFENMGVFPNSHDITRLVEIERARALREAAKLYDQRDKIESLESDEHSCGRSRRLQSICVDQKKEIESLESALDRLIEAGEKVLANTSQPMKRHGYFCAPDSGFENALTEAKKKASASKDKADAKPKRGKKK